jgi:hypothetical protein
VSLAARVFGFRRWRAHLQPDGTAAGDAIPLHNAPERGDALSRLADLAHALSRAPELTAVSSVASAHVPLLAPDRPVWVMARLAGLWTPLMAVGETPPMDREHAARRAMGECGLQITLPTDDECFPVLIADTPVCVLGVASAPPLSSDERRALAIAASLLAVSVKNAELTEALREMGPGDGAPGSASARDKPSKV